MQNKFSPIWHICPFFSITGSNSISDLYSSLDQIILYISWSHCVWMQNEFSPIWHISPIDISKIKTTSFHPQSNGMIKCFHRSLKSSLRARLASSSWVTHLPLVMLGLRSLPKHNSGFSPAEAVYGSNLSLPGDFLEHSKLPPEGFPQKVEQAVQGFSGPLQHHMIPQPQPRPLPRALMDAEFVFGRDDASKPLLSLLYRGPYCVLDILRSILLFRSRTNQILCLWTG